MLYSTFTAYLGFAVNEDEYKVMGLAAYGRPTMVDEVRKLIRRTPDGAFALVPEYFEYQTHGRRDRIRRSSSICSGRRASPTSRSTSRPPRAGASPISPPACSACSRTCWSTSPARCSSETGLPDLCFGGGVALNGVANARILAESGFERVFVPPAPGDAGCALGAALYADRDVLQAIPIATCPIIRSGARRSTPLELARVGARGRPAVDELDDARAASSGSPTISPPAASSAGWTAPASSGRARSAIAACSPRRTRSAMRDRLNRDIKYREEFRPFAPVVTAEAADAISSCRPAARGSRASCRACFRCGPNGARELAAVTHVDGTARVQVLERSMAPRLHALLEAYGRRSGIPVLLNTSFNVAGEPIVNARARGLLDVPPLRHRRARRRVDAS